MSLESLRAKIKEHGKGPSAGKVSFDMKIMFIYHIVMMVLFAVQPIEKARDQAVFALALGCVLMAILVAHKIKTNWKWPGLSVTSIPGVVFNTLFIYVFFAYASYSMNPDISAPTLAIENISEIFQESKEVIFQAASRPRFTPWFLAGIGIVTFNILSSLNFVSMKNRRTDLNCNDG